MAGTLTLREVLDTLRRKYGAPDPPARSAWEWVVWENVAYLVDDTRREEAWAALRRTVGLAPEAILAVPAERVAEAIRAGGMHPARRAERLQECARIALAVEGGLEAALRLPPREARRVIERFPGFGVPGADKVLLFTGTQPVLALESNGLRVLLRLGFGAEDRSYSKSYRSVQQALSAETSGMSGPALKGAYLLLRRLGQETCRRSDPACAACPLARRCPSCGQAG